MISFIGIITAMLWLPETLKSDDAADEAPGSPTSPSDSIGSLTSPQDPELLRRAVSSVSLRSPFA
jgi:hypothetical protein